MKTLNKKKTICCVISGSLLDGKYVISSLGSPFVLEMWKQHEKSFSLHAQHSQIFIFFGPSSVIFRNDNPTWFETEVGGLAFVYVRRLEFCWKPTCFYLVPESIQTVWSFSHNMSYCLCAGFRMLVIFFLLVFMNTFCQSSTMSNSEVLINQMSPNCSDAAILNSFDSKLDIFTSKFPKVIFFPEFDCWEGLIRPSCKRKFVLLWYHTADRWNHPKPKCF